MRGSASKSTGSQITRFQGITVGSVLGSVNVNGIPCEYIYAGVITAKNYSVVSNMAEEEEYHTHEDKLHDLLHKMIEENETDSDAAKDIKDMVIEIMQNEDNGDEDNKDLYRVIQKITTVLSVLNHQEYPYASIANEEITNIYNILYPNHEEEGEEY